MIFGTLSSQTHDSGYWSPEGRFTSDLKDLMSLSYLANTPEIKNLAQLQFFCPCYDASM